MSALWLLIGLSSTAAIVLRGEDASLREIPDRQTLRVLLDRHTINEVQI